MYFKYTQSLRAVLPCTHEKILVFNSGFPRNSLFLLGYMGFFEVTRFLELRIQQRIPQCFSLLLNPLSILRSSAQKLFLQWQQ